MVRISHFVHPMKFTGLYFMYQHFFGQVVPALSTSKFKIWGNLGSANLTWVSTAVSNASTKAKSDSLDFLNLLLDFYTECATMTHVIRPIFHGESIGANFTALRILKMCNICIFVQNGPVLCTILHISSHICTYHGTKQFHITPPICLFHVEHLLS